MRPFGTVALVLCLFVASSAFALEDRGSKADQDACTPDVFNLCSDLIPDETAILACLQGRKADLSVACAKVLFPNAPARRKSSQRG